MTRRLPIVSILILFLQSCNYPELIPLPAPVIEPTPIPTFVVPTEAPLNTETPLPEATATPSTPIAFPKEQPVNCRYGPDVKWAVSSALLLDQSAEILGKNTELTWWLIKDPLNPGESCWVSMSVTDTAGNLGMVELVPSPQASVTDITVNSNVAFTACGGPNPVSFSGSISANGPTTVTFHWEVGGDAQNTTNDETINFVEAGTREVTAEVFSADCGKFFVILRVSSPNEMFARKDFEIQAP